MEVQRETPIGCRPACDAARRLREQLDLGSMVFLNFIAALHARTKIGIPEADYPELFALDGAAGYLCR